MRFLRPVLALLLLCGTPPLALCQDKSAKGLKHIQTKQTKDLEEYQNLLSQSAHSELSCEDCHGTADLTSNKDLPPVLCGGCHDLEAQDYQRHGRLPVSGGNDVPTCANCHGAHDILYSGHQDSRVNPIHLSKTCGQCHENLDWIDKHDLLSKDAIAAHRCDIHRASSTNSNYPDACCTDCHGSEKTAHKILTPGNPSSSLNYFNIPKTCGECHKDIESDYWNHKANGGVPVRLSLVENTLRQSAPTVMASMESFKHQTLAHLSIPPGLPRRPAHPVTNQHC